MTTYAWPSGWGVRAFEMRVIPNLRSFSNPYSAGTSVVDLLGERWAVRLDLPPAFSAIEGAAREAYFDRLKGMAHTVALWHLRLPAPQGTMRGSPTLAASVAQLANTASVQTTAGATVRAGDMLGLAGQLVRVMADATANGSGVLAIEFQPRARVAMSSGAAVTWDKPTTPMMLRSATGVPTAWVPGYADGTSVEFVEP